MLLRFLASWVVGFMMLGTSALLCISSGKAMEQVCGASGLMLLSVGGPVAILIGITFFALLVMIIGVLLQDWWRNNTRWRAAPKACLILVSLMLVLASKIGMGFSAYFPNEQDLPHNPFPAPKLIFAMYPLIMLIIAAWPSSKEEECLDNKSRDTDATK